MNKLDSNFDTHIIKTCSINSLVSDKIKKNSFIEKMQYLNISTRTDYLIGCLL